MSTARPLKLLTPEEYLELEYFEEFRHEFIRGIRYRREDVRDWHAHIMTNLIGNLHPLAKSCRMFHSMMKLRAATDVFYYPDLSVTCGEQEHNYYVINPCVVVEIFSPTTESTDKREKLLTYLAIESLQAYILINQERQQVLGYYRTAEGWLKYAWQDEGEVPFPCLGSSLSLEGIYHRVFGD